MVVYDPLSAEAMTNPHALYAQLRTEDPVHYMAQYDAWALAGFDAVWQACSDTSSFSMKKGPIPYQVLLGEPASDLTFAGLDPPEHRLRRRVLAPHYTREAALADEPMIRAHARAVLEPLLARTDTFDAYADYSRIVAARVAADKVGVPVGDAETIHDKLDAAFEREPGQRGSSAANGAAMMDVFGYLFGEMMKARAAGAVAGSALATLLDAEVNGVPLTDEQVAAEMHTLLVTGADTTEFSVAAALYYLALDPTQYAEVMSSPSLAGFLFAEALRFDHPTDLLCRTVVKPVTIGGKQLQPEQPVLLLWASANRDEAEYPHADRFDIHRRYERSLLFGHGQHKCIGEHIGMRMGTVMLEELFARISGYEIDTANVGRRCGEFLKGFNKMPVTVARR